MSRDVVVTGLGAVCALGHDIEELLRGIELGRTGIAPIARFDTSDFSVRLGAEVKRWGSGAFDESATATQLCSGFAVQAAGEALTQAGLDTGATPSARIGLVFGTGLVDGHGPVHALTAGIADQLGLVGPRLTISTACSSSTGAIGVARDLLALNAADVVLAGGADILSPSVFAGFHALGVLSEMPCAPFSFPFGTTLGEGAGFLVLERADAARARGAPFLARLAGYGLSADGYHETSPDPEGRGVTRVVGAALSDSGLTPADIDYVNAHGSGTEANDPPELMGIRRALGRGDIPISSTKGALGHAQGAAGVLEAIVTILGMRDGFVPPTLHFAGARKAGPEDPVEGATPRTMPVSRALCLNSAFGGSNAALVFTTAPRTSEAPTQRRPVAVLGLGLVGPEGIRRGASGALAAGPRAGVVPPFDIEEIAPRTDPRGLDRSSRFLIAAATLSLSDAGVRVRGPLRDRTGMISAAIRPSPESSVAFGDSVSAGGLQGISVAAFARIVLNAPAGFCSKELGLRGPHTALTSGAGSGLLAIVMAAEILSTRQSVSMMLGTAVDERSPEDPIDSMAERAVSVVLAAPAAVEGHLSNEGAHKPVRLTGWGIDAPGRLNRAIETALLIEGSIDAPFDAVFRESDYVTEAAGDWAAPSALAFGDALVSLREGRAHRVVVTSDTGPGLGVAAILST